MKNEYLLPYFEKQINSLREDFYTFAKQYPESANGLGLTQDDIRDPQIKYLIESIAYLNAKIEHRLDDHFPQFTDEILALIYPHYLRPTPAICQTEFIPDAKMIAGQKIAKGSLFSGTNRQGEEIIFKTTSPVMLYPFEISAVEWISPPFNQKNAATCAIEFEISLMDKASTLSQFNVSELKLSLKGDENILWHLHDLLALDAVQCEIITTDSHIQQQQPTIRLDDMQQIMDYVSEQNEFPGWLMLHEAFLLPKRFLFFTLDMADLLLHCDDNKFKFRIYFSQWPDELVSSVNKENFALFLSAGINLFPHISEPMEINFTQQSYKLYLDSKKELTLYSIDKIQDITSDIIYDIPQLYKENYHEATAHQIAQNNWRWHLTHINSNQIPEISVANYQHTEVSLRIWQAHTQVTQNKQALEIQKYTELLPVETIGFSGKVNVITKPLISEMVDKSAESMMVILSHFQSNLANLLMAENPAACLKKWLLQYDRRYNHQLKSLIKSISQLSIEECVSPLRIGQNRLYFSGYKLILTLNLIDNIGGVSFFGQIIKHFLSSLADDTVFIQLNLHIEGIKQRKIHYPGRVGCQSLTQKR